MSSLNLVASRGWLHSRLICSSYLATIGTLIVLVANAVDVFTQQAIKFYSCQIPDPTTYASITRTTSYILDQFSELPMKAAIMNGLIGTSPEVITNCSTGFCSFQGLNDAGGASYTSLGICHKCANVSPMINLTHSSSNGFSLTNYTLPTGQHLNLPQGWSTGDSDSYGETLMSVNSSLQQALDPSQLSHLQASIANISILTFTYDDCQSQPGSCYGPPLDSPSDSVNQCNVLAIECSLYVCVKAYTATVTSGNLIEEVVSTHEVPLTPSVTWNSYGNSYYLSEIVPLPCLLGGNSLEASAIFSDYPINSSYREIKVNESQTYALFDCIFSIDNETTHGLTTYLSGSRSRSISTSSFSDQTLEPQPLLMGSVHSLDGVADLTSTPFWIEAFYNDGSASLESVNKTMEILTTAMTNGIRENESSGTGAMAKGITYHPQTCVRVRWAWLGFPIALVVGSVVFLIAIIH